MLDNRQYRAMTPERGELHKVSPTIAHNLCLMTLYRLRHREVAQAEHSSLTELGKSRLEFRTAEMTGILRVGYQREWSFEENSRNLYETV